MDEERSDRLDPIERVLVRWRGTELWLGLLLIVGGLVAVGAGWYQAAGTPDIRMQLQALISGGLGGLAAVLAGGFLVQAHLTASGFHRLNRQLGRVGDALLQLSDEAHAPSEAAGESAALHASWRPDDDTDVVGPVRVLASHASYHLPGCDLTSNRNGIRSISLREARAEALEPCRACAAEALA